MASKFLNNSSSSICSLGALAYSFLVTLRSNRFLGITRPPGLGYAVIAAVRMAEVVGPTDQFPKYIFDALGMLFLEIWIRAAVTISRLVKPPKRGE